MQRIEFTKTQNQDFVDRKPYQNKNCIIKTSQLTLRGGGCGSSMGQEVEQKGFPPIPNNLATKLKEYSNTLVEKASLLMDESQKEEIMIAIQWFYFNQQHFNTLCYKYHATQKIYSLLLECLDQLLKSAHIYLRGSGFLCIYVLQICNDLLRVVFSFLLKDSSNSKRYLEHTYKQQLQQYITSFESLLENEAANVWVSGIDFELSMVRSAIEHAPSNSTKKKELFAQFMNGMFKSIISMSPKEDLINALIEIGTMIVTEIYNKHYKNRIRKYEIYYFFETLKWAVLNQLRLQYSVKNVINSLIDGYKKYIINSSDWLSHFCWIRMISELASYRPIISKQENFTTEYQLNQWNSLVLNKQIVILSYSTQHARVLFKDDLKKNPEQSTKIFSFAGEDSFRLFFKILMGQKISDEIRLWSDYITFSFQNLPKKQQGQILVSINEFLFGNQEIELFETQNIYLEEIIGQFQALNRQIQQQFENFYNEPVKPQNIRDIYADDIRFKQQQLKEKLIQIMQLVFLIQFTSTQFAEKFKLFQIYLQANHVRKESILKDKTNKTPKQVQRHQQKVERDNTIISQIALISQQQVRQEQSIKDFIALYPQFVKILTNQELEKDKIKSSQSSGQDGVRQSQILEEINYESKFKLLKNDSKKFLSLVISIQKENFVFFNKKQKEAKQLSLISYERFISVIARTIANPIPYTIKTLMDQLNLNLDNPQQFICPTSQQHSQSSIQSYANCSILLNCCNFFPQILKIFQHEATKIADGLKTLLINYKQITDLNQQNQFQNYNNLEVIQQIIRLQKEKVRNLFDQNNENFDQELFELVKQIQVDLNQLQINSKSNQVPTEIQGYELLSFKVAQLLLELQLMQSDKDRFAELKNEILDAYKELDTVPPSPLTSSESQVQPSLIKLTSFQETTNFGSVYTFKNEDFDSFSKKYGIQIANPNFYSTIESTLNDLIKSTQALQVFFQSNSRFETFKQDENLKKRTQQLRENLLKKFCEKYDNFRLTVLDLVGKQLIDNTNQKTDLLQDQPLLWDIKQYFDILNTYDNDEIFSTQEDEKENILKHISNKLESNLDKQVDKGDSNEYDHKVKECLVFHLLKMQSVVPEQIVTNFCQNQIQLIWGMESDGRVKKLLKNKEMIDIQKKMFSQDLQQFSDRLKQDINQRLDQLNQLEFQLGQEGIQQKRQELQKELDLKYQEFDKYLDGITDMAAKLDLSLLFLKDIRKQLSQIKTKIDLIQNSIIDIGKDLRKLKGKNYYDLLMMRRETVLEQKQQFDMRSVYIPLKTLEWDPKTGLKLPGSRSEETILLSDDQFDKEAEVNEFLYEEKDKDKDAMLIRGFAGSGKSRAAKKIEEFLWVTYDQDDKSRKKWTPIFVSLPTIREPRFNLVSQALESDFYRFDQIQIREFKTAIQEKKLNIVLILDSYDEMKSDFIQKNLYLTNSLNLEFFQSDLTAQSEKQFKIIITTRNEILLSKSYQIWFCGYDVSTMKEVEILQFDQSQNEAYLNQFTTLNIKKFILEMYEFFLQVQNLKFKAEQFQVIWEKVSKVIENKSLQSEDLLLDESQIDNIIREVNSIYLFKNASQEQLKNLTKELASLWSVKKFQKAIKNININKLLTTPFMMEIVVQVLPNMIQNFSKASVLREYFLKNYVQIKLIFSREERRIARYKNKSAAKAKEAYPTEQELIEQAKKLWETLEKKNIFKNFSIDDDYKTESANQISIANEKFDVGQEASIIIRTLKQQQLTNYDFYYSFVQFYHQKQIQKQMQLGRAYNFESLSIDLIQYSQSLALDMTRNQLTQVNYRVKGQLNIRYLQNLENVSWEEMYFNDFQGDGDYKKIIRSCTLLNQKGSNFSFTHKSIQEFYVAKYFIEQLEQFKLVDDTKLKNFMTNFSKIKQNTYKAVLGYYRDKKLFKDGFTLDDFNLIWQQYFVTVKDGIWNQPEFNLSLETFRGCLKLMRFKLKQMNKLKPLLLQQIYLSRYEEAFIQAASNSIFILTFINEYFGNEDLSQIRISNTKLNGASFFMANLSESKFNNVDINSCNFNCANLSKVQWENFKFQNTQGYEGHKAKINDIKIVQKKYVISCSNDASIIIWDLKTSNILKRFEYHTKQVTTLLIFDNEKCFASVGLDKQIIIYKIDGDKFEKMTNLVTQDPLYSIAHAKKMNFFVVGGKERILVIEFNDNRLQVQEGISTGEKVMDLAISPDDQILAASIGKNIRLFIIGQDLRKKDTIQKELLEGHKNNVLTISFFEDSRQLVSGGQDKLINIWDVYSGKVVQTITDNTAAIISISILNYYEQNKITKLAYGDGKIIKIWDVQAGKTTNTIEGHANIITSVVLATSEKNEKYIIFGSDDAVMRSLSVDSQEDSCGQEGHSQEVTSISFSPDGLFVASGSWDKTVKIWETRTGKQIADLSQHKSKITQVLFSPNGEILASISEGESIYLWDAKTYSYIKKIDRSAQVKTQKDAQKNDKETNVATSTVNTFSKSNAETIIQEFKDKHQIFQLVSMDENPEYAFATGCLEGKILGAKIDQLELEQLYEHKSAIYSLDYAKGTKSLGSGSQDGEIKIWSVEKKQVIYSFQYKKPVLALAILSDTIEFVSGHSDGIVKKFKENQEQNEWKLGDEDISSIQISSKTSQALVGSSDFSVYQINFDQREAKIFKEEVTLQVLELSTQHKYLATGNASSITLWDLLTNQFKARLKAHVGDVSSISFSNDDLMMASGGTDDLIHLWNLKTVDIKLIGTLYGHTSTITRICFNLNEQKEETLVSSSKDCSIRMWDLQDFDQIMRLEYQEEPIISFVVFNKSQQLASASQDKSVAIINMQNGSLIKHLNENKEKKILSLTISQDDAILAVSYEDYSINVYRTQGWQFEERKQDSIILKIQFSYFNKDQLYLQKGKSFAVYQISTKKTTDIIQDFDQGFFCLCKTKDSLAYSKKTCLVIKNLKDLKQEDQYLQLAKEAAITALATSKNGQYFTTGKADGMITVWHIQKQFYYHLEYHKNRITFLQFIGEDELISAGWDKEIVLWKFLDKTPTSLRTFKSKITGVAIKPDSTILVAELQANALNEALNLSFGAFSSKGDIFVFRSLVGTLHFRDIKKEENEISVYKQAHNQLATAACFSKNDDYFAYGNGDDNIIVVKKDSNEKQFVLDEHKNYITAIAFANSKKQLASGSIDMVVYIWEFEKPQQSPIITIKELNKPISSLSFWIEDYILAVGGEVKQVLLYNVDGKAPLTFLEGHLSGITSLEFSPSGQTLATASKDYCIKLWKLKKDKVTKQQNRQSVQQVEPVTEPNKKQKNLEQFQTNLFCYKTLGLNYQFEANQVILEGANIKNNEEESLLNNFQKNK